MLGTAETGWDWYSDKDWAAAEANLSAMASCAQAGHFKGIAFDPEPYDCYGQSAWTYALQPGASSHDFAQMQVQVRSRGKQFIQTFQAQMPEGKVFCTGLLSFMASLFDDAAKDLPANLKAHNYGLWPAFINGMLDGMNEKVQLLDGNESAYYFRRSSDFEKSRTTILTDAQVLVEAANLAKYQRQVKVLQSVYLDGVLDLHRSSYFLYFGYYLANDAERLQYLEHNAFEALKNTDDFVWVYGETLSKVDWWASKAPVGVEAKLFSALTKATTNAPLGFDFGPTVTAGEARMLVISGRITQGSHGVSGVSFTLSTDNDPTDKVYATSTNSEGYFTCRVKAGWSGTLTPVKTGITFTPSSRHFSGISSSTSKQDFTTP